MNRLKIKNQNLAQRKNRIRATVKGTTTRPRMSVFISNLHVSIQIIDDTTHKTLASVTTVGQKNTGDTMTAKAEWAGAQIAKEAKAHKINKVVLDRNGRKYHGRIKALAEKARAEGLEF